ncbi:unnamed protein product [Adineta ricciae]|uniref:CRAL-TRIO domain-containing protein n=1 Tax=Adineta ricciae TaxID=249248 RepID=A0A815WDY9_ADIRI|nr:unnamed protein product [Adineta ricciae]
MRNIDFQLVRNFLNLFQNYYPESLGLGLIVNASWIFSSCWSMICPWLDSDVENTIKFLRKESDLTKYIDPMNIPQRLQGKHVNFRYFLPTDEDQQMIEIFRQDQKGKQFNENNYQQAMTKYIQITLKWAQNEDNSNLIIERNKSCRNLLNAYENLLPYVTTRIHYHRTNEIHEPIFEMTYKKLSETHFDDVTYF